MKNLNVFFFNQCLKYFSFLTNLNKLTTKKIENLEFNKFS